MDAMKPTSRFRSHDCRPALTRRVLLKGAAATPVAFAMTRMGTPLARASAPEGAECGIEVSCPELVVSDTGVISGWVGGRHYGAHGDSTVNESAFRPDGACGAGYALGVHVTGQQPSAVEVHATISGRSRGLPAGRTGWAVPAGFQLFSIEAWPTGPCPGPGRIAGTTANIEGLSAWNGTVTRDSKLILGREVVRLYTMDYLGTGPLLPDTGARYDRSRGRPVVSPLEARAGYSPNRSGGFQHAVAALIDGAEHRFLVQTRGLVHAPDADLDLLPVPQEGVLEITVRRRGDEQPLATRSYPLSMAHVGV